MRKQQKINTYHLSYLWRVHVLLCSLFTTNCTHNDGLHDVNLVDLLIQKHAWPWPKYFIKIHFKQLNDTVVLMTVVLHNLMRLQCIGYKAVRIQNHISQFIIVHFYDFMLTLFQVHQEQLRSLVHQTRTRYYRVTIS